jgi:hypothetical protein
MHKRAATLLIVLLCLSLASVKAQGKKITVLDPRGNPPATTLLPMAQRLDSLDGKTVYFVDNGFVGGEFLLKEMMSWFGKNKPQAKMEFRKKAGSFLDEDPSLWAEIAQKADAVVMATGH